MKQVAHAAALAAVLKVALPVPAFAQGAALEFERYLGRVGLTAAERASASAGTPVVKLLTTKNDRDVAVFGVIRLRVSHDTAVARTRQFEQWLPARGSKFGVFSSPPDIKDVRGVALPPSEYRDLRKCRRGDCDFKLPAYGMKWLVENVDWSASDAQAQADARVRTAMVNLASDYLAKGNKAMLTYDDRGGVRGADVFDSLLTQSTNLYQYAPELQRYLTDFPANKPANARDVLYWSDDRVPRLRPTLTLNHVVTYAPAAGLAVIAKKQIYASHYFEGGFELLALIDARSAPDSREAATYLVTVRRFRFDNLPGGILNIRGRVQEQMQATTQNDLSRDRGFIERTK